MTKHLGKSRDTIDTYVYVAHRIAENKENNDLVNLELMTKSEHTRLHNTDLTVEIDEQGKFTKQLNGRGYKWVKK